MIEMAVSHACSAADQMISVGGVSVLGINNRSGTPHSDGAGDQPLSLDARAENTLPLRLDVRFAGGHQPMLSIPL